jgi:hypothetical protein
MISGLRALFIVHSISTGPNSVTQTRFTQSSPEKRGSIKMVCRLRLVAKAP